MRPPPLIVEVRGRAAGSAPAPARPPAGVDPRGDEGPGRRPLPAHGHRVPGTPTGQNAECLNLPVMRDALRTGPMSDPRAALRDLLLSLFDAPSLRRWLAAGEGEPNWLDALPGESAPLVELVHRCVDLWARHGAIDDRLFARLARDFPRRRPEIEAVRGRALAGPVEARLGRRELLTGFGAAALGFVGGGATATPPPPAYALRGRPAWNSSVLYGDDGREVPLPADTREELIRFLDVLHHEDFTAPLRFRTLATVLAFGDDEQVRLTIGVADYRPTSRAAWLYSFASADGPIRIHRDLSWRAGPADPWTPASRAAAWEPRDAPTRGDGTVVLSALDPRAHGIAAGELLFVEITHYRAHAKAIEPWILWNSRLLAADGEAISALVFAAGSRVQPIRQLYQLRRTDRVEYTVLELPADRDPELWPRLAAQLAVAPAIAESDAIDPGARAIVREAEWAVHDAVARGTSEHLIVRLDAGSVAELPHAQGLDELLLLVFSAGQG